MKDLRQRCFYLTACFVLCSFLACPPMSMPGASSTSPRVVHAGDFPVLSSPPFAMPQGFPVVPGATKVNKPLKGSTLSFSTKMSLPEIDSFYRSRMTGAGLTEATHTTLRKEQMLSLSFFGWPNNKTLTIQAVDLAYSSSTDERMVNVRLE